MALPRGLRNNNPGNINFANQPNSRCELGGRGRFAVFNTMEDGINALKDQLLRYFNAGTDTVASIIERWAPPTENHTEYYISFVAAKLGVTPTTRLTPDSTILAALMNAIIQYENGENPIENIVKNCVLEAPN